MSGEIEATRKPVRWGRTKGQLVCSGLDCKRIIEEGEAVLFLRIGEGVLCGECGQRLLPREAAR